MLCLLSSCSQGAGARRSEDEMNEARLLIATGRNLTMAERTYSAPRRGAAPIEAASGDRRAREVSFRLLSPVTP